VHERALEHAAVVLPRWLEALGEGSQLASTVITVALKHPELRKALLPVSARHDDPTKFDPQRLDMWLARVEGHEIGGLRCVRDRTIAGAMIWRMSRVSSSSPTPDDVDYEASSDPNAQKPSTDHDERF
jgi:hypothetical protein